MNKNKNIKQTDPVIVAENNYGSCIDIIEGKTFKDVDVCKITLQQGTKKAFLLGDINLSIELDLEPYKVLTKGKIVTKEKLHPFNLKKPDKHIKRSKDGKVCTKDGRIVYSQSYYTLNIKEEDEIIQED